MNYEMNCFLCAENSRLRMFPHRDLKGRMVGWIFVCCNHDDSELPETLNFE